MHPTSPGKPFTTKNATLDRLLLLDLTSDRSAQGDKATKSDGGSARSSSWQLPKTRFSFLLLDESKRQELHRTNLQLTKEILKVLSPENRFELANQITWGSQIPTALDRLTLAKISFKQILELTETHFILWPWSLSYGSTKINENERFIRSPLLIAFPRTAREVQTFVNLGTQHALSLTIRSGGHCYEDFSINAEIVIDTSILGGQAPLSPPAASPCSSSSSSAINVVKGDDSQGQIVLDECKKVVHVSPGVRLGVLYTYLNQRGYTCSAGICSSVAVGGHVSVGGIGYSSRTLGLAAQNIVSAEIVLAGGVDGGAKRRKLEEDGKYADLLRACRGAGAGNFGVLTRFTLRVYPATEVLLFNVIYDICDAARVVNRLQKYVYTAPENFGLAGAAFVAGVPLISISGQWNPSKGESLEDAQRHLEAFLKKVLEPRVTKKCFSSKCSSTKTSSVSSTSSKSSATARLVPLVPLIIVRVSAYEAANLLAFLNPGLPFTKVRSSFFFEPISREGLKKFFQFVAQPLPPTGPQHDRMIPAGQISILGGAVRTKLPEDKAVLLEQHAVGWFQTTTFWQQQEDEPVALAFTNKYFETMQPYVSRHAYYGYPDLELGPDYLESYFGKHMPFLREVKTKYDPTNVFKFKQSIPPLSSTSPSSLIEVKD